MREDMIKIGAGMQILHIFALVTLILIFKIDWIIDLILKIALIGGYVFFNIISIFLILIGLLSRERY